MRNLPPKKKDTLNLQALLSAPVTCTLPLKDLLKVKPELWDEVAVFMSGRESKSRSLGLKDLVKEHSNVHSKPTPIPINKVGQYEGDDGNTTLPVTINKMKSIAILDSGV